jgi:hypothetical protein
VFSWLQFKDEKKRDDILNLVKMEAIFDDDIQKQEKDYKGDDCEIETSSFLSFFYVM